MSCGVGHRHGSDPGLLWLWHRLAASAPIRPLAWETPYAMGVAQEMAKTQKKKKKIGVPIVVQWKRIQQGTVRLKVQSLVLLSGLRIWCCCELWCRSQMWLRSRVAVAVAVA